MTPIVSLPAEPRIRAAWWGVVARFLVHGLVISTWVSRIAGVKATLRLSDGTLGLALFGAAVGSGIAIPFTGWLISKYGSRRAAIWSTIGLASALVLPALAVNAWTLTAGLVVYGFMAGSNDVSMNSNAVGVEKLLPRPTISRIHAMFSIGGIFGAAVGGAIAGWGISPLVHLGGASVLLVAFSVATSPLLIETTATTGKRSKVSWFHLPRTLFLLSLIGFCIFMSEGAIADWTAVYLAQVLGAGHGLAAQGYAVFSISMALFRFFGDQIAYRLGRAWTIRLGGAIAAIGMTWMLSMSNPYWALPGLMLAGAGYSSIIPLVFAGGGRLQGVDPAVGVATVSGLGYLAFLVGPPLIGAISEFSSLRFGLFVLVALAVLASSLVGAVFPKETNPGGGA